MGYRSTADAATRLCQLLDELERWNRSFNLTAITHRAQMVTHHLLDSLSIAPFLHGQRVIDIGTGAGFPGLPLAIVQPERQFTLLDSNGKKVRFVAHRGAYAPACRTCRRYTHVPNNGKTSTVFLTRC